MDFENDTNIENIDKNKNIALIVIFYIHIRNVKIKWVLDSKLHDSNDAA